ncbi:histidine kinase [Nocardiopsis mangrovi]|uniref:histidine kinase n=1 Tax=Nocardiopsis mangrovi TaxID=1179818 RepID=A0ABV9DU53_9ACTN
MFYTVLVPLFWVTGRYAKVRRDYPVGLEERAEGLERERDARAHAAIPAERARIARETHDVVARNLSVIVVQADGATCAIDSAPARAKRGPGDDRRDRAGGARRAARDTRGAPRGRARRGVRARARCAEPGTAGRPDAPRRTAGGAGRGRAVARTANAAPGARERPGPRRPGRATGAARNRGPRGGAGGG